jgi:NAD(P)-dependent dehydrogenase (short-subunit alcohol dehydrogenase family)
MNKIALVIGGCRGIGKAIGLELSNQGFYTYATSRNSMQAEGRKVVTPIYLDLTDSESIDHAFAKIEENHGKLDILVNNAGISLPKPAEDVNWTELETVFQTNVFGPFLCMQKAFPLLNKSGGRIINITSIVTKRVLPGNAVYTASKQALKGFGDVLAEEWYKYNIQTTNLVLGATYTDLWKDVKNVSPDDLLDVQDVSRAVAFIATSPLDVRIDEITLTPPKGIV